MQQPQQLGSQARSSSTWTLPCCESEKVVPGAASVHRPMVQIACTVLQRLHSISLIHDEQILCKSKRL